LIPKIIGEISMSSIFPIAFSLISDYFHPDHRGRANGVFALGIYLGNGLSSLTLTLIENIGWRNGYIVVAICCGIFSITIFFLKEPKRGSYDEQYLKMVENVTE
jgi:MFS family permease